jgi:riboflavin biosynthesis pyrimidine reductase
LVARVAQGALRLVVALIGRGELLAGVLGVPRARFRDQVCLTKRVLRGRQAPLLGALAALGITRILVEGGAVLSAALIGQDLIDRIAWFRAPNLIGGDGRPAVGDLGVENIGDMPSFALISRESIGDDTLDIYRRLP